ncbi:MAG: cyclase family protein, partial [Mesorhizobium sp.]
MDTQKLLGEVAGQLLSGAIKVVDLSAPLGPNTPLIKLPPELAVDTPKVEI